MQHRESLQLSSILVVLEVKTLPDRPPEATGSPGGSQEGPRRVPGEPRESPKASRSRPLDPPRSPKGGPRVAQSHPRGPRSTPKSGKSRLKRTQDEFQTRCASRTVFSTDFASKLLPKLTCKSVANCEESFAKAVIDQGSDVARIMVLPR